MYRLASVTADGIHWVLRRNCSVTPRQLGAMYALLSTLSLVVAGFFWTHGVWMVLLFSVVELLVVAVAFLVYARHAADGEHISLSCGRLVVEQEEAGRLLRVEFAGHAVSVDAPSDRQSLVSVRGGGCSADVGRYVRAELRPVLAQEIRRALRGA
jgi:uncharacterized membrane protein